MTGTKADLRRTMTAVRSRIARDEALQRVEGFCRRLVMLLAGLAPRRLVAYAPLAGEIDPGPVAGAYAAAGVPVFLPRWQDGRSEFAHLETGERLVDDDQSVVILVPGIAFDSSGHRLGRGGGWYDRVLASHPHAVRVGCAYDEQVIDQLPLDPWDARMHHVVTDARSIAVDQTARPAGECAHEWT
jgi:5-formyltetrahydrofolate cyclo-ligase